MTQYWNAARAGAHHGASGREPAPPSPSISDRIDDALFGTSKVEERAKEAQEYHQAYASATLHRIADK
ncbi:hypothetical protein [Bradyrhizobium acaciae]|uniref:hypothetical protein n=1 Tax=Bradyrhizobium acaciae TaxID=2683706 RepID=UPI001E3ECA28|nr:hypothetical protein [Bradyrhizobium acaciae]MCC8977590.1 hypothetical protein [Bradyrhizobium acaciae]